MDMMFIFQNIYIYYLLVRSFSVDGASEEFETIVKRSRQVIILGIISLYAKASYFFSLIDEIAPLIDIIV